MIDSIITINSLTKKYGNVVALNNVNLNFPKGQIIGLLGPNGSGKTTMIKILTSLLNKYDGNVLIDGKKIGVETKKIVSYLPDRNILPPRMKIIDILDYFGDFFDDFDKVYANKLIKSLEVDLNRRFCELSKGMKEKVQLSLVLSRKAKVYIFDEPIAGVDPAARDVIFELIMNSKREDATIIICTHLISEVENILDYAIFLKNGVVTLRNDVKTIKENSGKTLNEIFKEVYHYAPIS